MHIDDYEYGRIVIDGREERRDVVLTSTLYPNWWREEGHALRTADLGPVLDAEPELLIVGTGTAGNLRPEPGLEQALGDRGIAVETMRTAEAVQRYNELAAGGNVAAALHLTC